MSKFRLRLVFTVGLVIGVVGTVGTVFSTLAALRGAEADAVIVRVERSGLKTMLTVRFAANDGTACESSFRSDSSGSATQGDRIRIRHPAGDPCINVGPANDVISWDGTVVAGILTIVFAIGFYVAWWRPHIPPPRYADMP